MWLSALNTSTIPSMFTPPSEKRRWTRRSTRWIGSPTKLLRGTIEPSGRVRFSSVAERATARADLADAKHIGAPLGGESLTGPEEIHARELEAVRQIPDTGRDRAMTLIADPE